MAAKSVTTLAGGGDLDLLLGVLEGFHSAYRKWPKKVTMPTSSIGSLAAIHLTAEGFGRLLKKVRLQGGNEVLAEGVRGQVYSLPVGTRGAAVSQPRAHEWLTIDLQPKREDEPTKPGYTRRKPLYPVCKELPQRLGEQDAYITLTEVALRFLEKLVASNGEGRAFGNAVASQLRIPTEFGQWDLARQNGHLFAITQVMTVADNFFRRLGREYRFYKGLTSWKSQNGNEQLDALQALYENLPGEARKRVRNAPEFDLIQYYRLVRNRLIHGQGQDLDPVHADLLTQHKQHFADAYDCEPNKYSAINTTDFLLLTRAIKYYARLLNDACDLDPKDIVAFHVGREALDLPKDPVGPTGGPWLTTIRQAKSSPVKLSGLVARFEGQYGLAADQRGSLEEALIAFLSADPPKRIRRQNRKKLA